MTVSGPGRVALRAGAGAPRPEGSGLSACRRRAGPIARGASGGV